MSDTDELQRELIRKDIARMTQEILNEPRKYRLHLWIALISAVLAGSVIGGGFAYLLTHQPPQHQDITVHIEGALPVHIEGTPPR